MRRDCGIADTVGSRVSGISGVFGVVGGTDISAVRRARLLVVHGIVSATWHSVGHHDSETPVSIRKLDPHGLGGAVQPMRLDRTRARLTDR